MTFTAPLPADLEETVRAIAPPELAETIFAPPAAPDADQA
jgi:hypothetical protein